MPSHTKSEQKKNRNRAAGAALSAVGAKILGNEVPVIKDREEKKLEEERPKLSQTDARTVKAIKNKPRNTGQ